MQIINIRDSACAEKTVSIDKYVLDLKELSSDISVRENSENVKNGSLENANNSFFSENLQNNQKMNYNLLNKINAY